MGSYRARFTVQYEMGMDVQQDDLRKNAPPAPPNDSASGEGKEENMQIKPADEDETYSWSNNAVPDMLF